MFCGLQSILGSTPSSDVAGVHAQQGSTHAQRLNPIISRLTQVSENIFVQNVQHGLRLSARIDLGALNQQVDNEGSMGDNVGGLQGDEQSLPSVHSASTQSQSNTASLAININNSSSACMHTSNSNSNIGVDGLSDGTSRSGVYGNNSHDNVGAYTSYGNTSLHDKGTPNTDSAKCESDTFSANMLASGKDCPFKGNHSPQKTGDEIASLDSSDSEPEMSNNKSDESSSGDSHVVELTPMPGPDDIEGLRQRALADIEKIEAEAPSPSFILDRALNAAITEKGLHLQ